MEGHYQVVLKIDPSLKEAFHALATNEQERNFIAEAIDHRALGIPTFRWEDMSWSEEEDPLIKRIMDFIRKVCEATDRSSAAPDAGFFSLHTGEGKEELKLGKWYELGLYTETHLIDDEVRAVSEKRQDVHMIAVEILREMKSRGVNMNDHEAVQDALGDLIHEQLQAVGHQIEDAVNDLVEGMYPHNAAATPRM